MNRLTKAGILLVVIGLSFLVSALYRSTTESGSFTTSSGMGGGLAPNTWNVDWNASHPYVPSFIKYFLIPREHRMGIQTNTAIDVYILDSKGAQLWLDKGKLEPIASFKGVKQQVVTFNIHNRDDYSLLIYNPSAENAPYSLSVTGYGIETDLLYLSLIFIVFGAVATLVSFIPRGKGGKKQSLAKTRAVFPVTVFAILMLSLPTASCAAQFQASSILAPSWMKKGTYVDYEFLQLGRSPSGVVETSTNAYISFLNGSRIKFRNVTSVIFRWECTAIEENMVTLDASYSVTSDLASDNFYTSISVDVDVATRNVYRQDGTLIGTTTLWLPSNPAEGQEVTLWDVPPDKSTAIVKTKELDGENMYLSQASQLSQGAQRVFRLQNTTGTINGQQVNAMFFEGFNNYEYETGLLIIGFMPFEPMLNLLSIRTHEPNISMNTNVDLGPAKTIINWSYVLGVAAFVASIVVIATYLLIRRRRQRR